MKIIKDSICFYLHYPTNVPLDHEGPFLEKAALVRESVDAIDDVTVVDDQGDADFHIALLEHYPDNFVRDIVELSQRDVKLWCFVPRGMRVPMLISDEVRIRGGAQRIYPYDDADEIRRMVEYLVRDLKSATA